MVGKAASLGRLAVPLPSHVVLPVRARAVEEEPVGRTPVLPKSLGQPGTLLRFEQPEVVRVRLADALSELAHTRQSSLDRSYLHIDGDFLFKNISSPASFREFLIIAAKGLKIFPSVLAERVRVNYTDDSILQKPMLLEHLPKVIEVLNLFDFENPGEVLYKLYKDIFDWAFTVLKPKEKVLVFALKEPAGLEVLKIAGLQSVLSPRRLERNWSLDALLERVNRYLEKKIGRSQLGNFLRNRAIPNFAQLKAIVSALNEEVGPLKKRVDPGLALLAAYPALIPLLNLRVRESEIVYPLAPSSTQLQSQNRDVDPKGLPALLRQARAERLETQEASAARLGLSAGAFNRLEQDPPPHPTPEAAPGRLVLKFIADQKGFGLSMAEVLKRHQYSYWRFNPIVQKLVRRTFRKPLLIDLLSFPKLEGYLQYDFQTPGEILYYWRNSGDNLPTISEIADLLEVKLQSYNAWELNQSVPNDDEIAAIVQKLGRSPAEGEMLEKACQQMREVLYKNVRSLPNTGWMREWPGVRKFFRLALLRPFYSAQDIRALRQRLLFIKEKNPASLTFLEEKGAELGLDHDSKEVRRLIDTLARVEQTLLKARNNVTYEGPVAAVYYYGGNFLHLKNAHPEKQSHTEVVIDKKTGHYELKIF